MITTLILDDNSDKVERVFDAIKALPEIDISSVDIAVDLIQARDLCHQKQYNLLILDLCLPNREGDTSDDVAGCDFIKELNASTTLFKPYHILGLTEYEDALAKAGPFFAEELWRIIKYDSQSSDWRRQLTAKLSYLINSKKVLQRTNVNKYIYDIGIVTALHIPELRSILDLPADWSEIKQPNDSTVYYRGQFVANGKTLSVVAASAPQMGMAATTVLSMKLISGFRPRFIAITGIAAGVKGGEARLGDILVADRSWDYESGKYKIVDDNQIFEPDPHSIPLGVDIKERILRLKTEDSFLRDIEKKWRGVKPLGRLEIHIGPMASGAAVIQNGTITANVKAHNRKLIGLDMETYGVFFASENCSQPRPTPISMKSVCDFADEDKSDDYQAYASFTSAEYFYRFALSNLSNPEK